MGIGKSFTFDEKTWTAMRRERAKEGREYREMMRNEEGGERWEGVYKDLKIWNWEKLQGKDDRWRARGMFWTRSLICLQKTSRCRCKIQGFCSSSYFVQLRIYGKFLVCRFHGAKPCLLDPNSVYGVWLEPRPKWIGFMLGVRPKRVQFKPK